MEGLLVEVCIDRSSLCMYGRGGLLCGVSPGSLCKSIVMTEGSGRGGRSPFLVFLVFLTPSHLLFVCLVPPVSSLLSYLCVCVWGHLMSLSRAGSLSEWVEEYRHVYVYRHVSLFNRQ